MQFKLPILLLWLIAITTQHAMEPVIHDSTQILDQSNKPVPALAQLLEKFNLNPQSPQELVTQTQKAWLRTNDKERWEAEDPYASRKEELMPLFAQMGLVYEVKPQLQKYDYLLILGALRERAQLRMQHAINLWQEGIRFDEIILLGCERPLDPQKELSSAFGDTSPAPKTEYEMMKWIYENMAMPEEMRSVKTSYINSPNKITSDGKIARATTADTIIDWLKTSPKPSSSILLISNQPFIRYQQSIGQTYLPTFTVDTAGLVLSPQARVTDILDSLARWIYTELNTKKIGHGTK